MEKINVSRRFYKNPSNTNPLLSNFFCADPSAIEYEGRLYVYGTNDNQQYQIEGDFGKNTYEKIKSLVCFSTDDMVNWTFHGVVDIENIATWSLTSWAPAIISRKEEGGLTHFYMYFSNTGYGVGVVTATNPLGPWTSPLDYSLVYTGMKGIEEVPNPFDPGVCLDKDGNGWLVFGGGLVEGHTEDLQGSARIVKLGKDLLSFDSDFVEIPAPYFFEASDIYFINDTYVYTYCSNWLERKNWNYDGEPSTQCSIDYMYTKTPLDKDSWVYGGNLFKNPGDQGLNYSNNHGYIARFKDKNYLLYHTLTLQEDTDTNGGFRSICADVVDIVENGEGFSEIKMCNGTRSGVSKVSNLNPYKKISGSTFLTCAQISYDSEKLGDEIGAKADCSGAWFIVKNVDFGEKAEKIKVYVTGGITDSRIEVRVNKLSSGAVAVIPGDNEGEVIIDFIEKLSGLNDLYFVFSHENLIIKNWIIE